MKNLIFIFFVIGSYSAISQTDNSKPLFDSLVSKGDKELLAGRILEAKKSYNRAIVLDSTDNYVTEKINSIDSMLKNKLSKKTVQDILLNIYTSDDAIHIRDSLSSVYQSNKFCYVTLKNEILDGQILLEDLEDVRIHFLKKEGEEEIERQYQKVLKTADKCYKEGDFKRAIELYERCIKFKPDEKYPKKMLKKAQKKNKKS